MSEKNRHNLSESAGMDALGIIQELIRQIRIDAVTPEMLQAYLQLTKKQRTAIMEHRNPFSTILSVVQILGDNKVLAAEKVASVWSVNAPIDVQIRYNEKTLKKCAIENGTKYQHDYCADWRLIYIAGMSLREMFAKDMTFLDLTGEEIVGDMKWLGDKYDYKPEPGYYLINFGPTNWEQLHIGWNWTEVEESIKGLGRQFERCNDTVYVEACFSLKMTTGNENLPRYYSRHQGSYEVKGGKGYHKDPAIRVWEFCEEGMGVMADRIQGEGSGIDPKIFRKFDF